MAHVIGPFYIGFLNFDGVSSIEETLLDLPLLLSHCIVRHGV